MDHISDISRISQKQSTTGNIQKLLFKVSCFIGFGEYRHTKQFFPVWHWQGFQFRIRILRIAFHCPDISKVESGKALRPHHLCSGQPDTGCVSGDFLWDAHRDIEIIGIGDIGVAISIKSGRGQHANMIAVHYRYFRKTGITNNTANIGTGC